MHVFESYGKTVLTFRCLIIHYNAYKRTVTGVSKEKYKS